MHRESIDRHRHIDRQSIPGRRGHKPRAHLRGRATGLGYFQALIWPVTVLTCQEGGPCESSSRRAQRKGVGGQDGGKEEHKRKGEGEAQGGGTGSAREWVCSSVSCLLLVGPMQELDPHLHPAEAQREEPGCRELSQGSGRAGRDQSGTVGLSLHFSHWVTRKSSIRPSPALPPLSLPPKGHTFLNQVVTPPRCPHPL